MPVQFAPLEIIMKHEEKKKTIQKINEREKICVSEAHKKLFAFGTAKEQTVKKGEKAAS